MKAFLSSTYKDLIEHRKAAHDATQYVDLTGFHKGLVERVDSDSHALWLSQVTMKPVRSGIQGWEK